MIRRLERRDLEEVASLVAHEQDAARGLHPLLPDMFARPGTCQEALDGLLGDGFVGFVAVDAGRCVGAMCGRTTDGVGFVPAHGVTVEPDVLDPTTIVARLFAELAPLLLDDGATRFTIDHVPLDPLGAALSNLGFGRAGVFATQHPRPNATAAPDVRIATPDDLDSIAELSQIELDHRATPPIYAPAEPRRLAETRDLHQRLVQDGAVHFLARREGDDVGLLTVEFTSPTPRLCQPGQPYIGATATRPRARHAGIGTRLVLSALDWAASAGHHAVSVDFDSANPLSRPFWLGLGFRPTGYRLRRTIDARHHRHPVGVGHSW